MPARPNTFALPLVRDTAARILFLGVALIVIAFTAPLPSSAVTATMVSGVAVALIGVATPRIAELEIGPSGFKTKLRDVAEAPPNLLELRTEDLSEFALLICGDAAQARQMVEKAMAKAASQPKSDRDEFTLHRLIDFLESAADRRWLQARSIVGSSETSGPNAQRIIDELQKVAFYPRVCFLLHARLDMTPAEAARVLDRPVQDVIAAIETARNVILPGDRGGQRD